MDTRIRWEVAAGGALGEEDSVVSALEGHKAYKPAQIEHNTNSNQTQNLSNMLRKYTYTQYTNARTHAQASRQAGTYTHTPGDGRGETLETDNRRRSESIQHKATSSGALHWRPKLPPSLAAGPWLALLQAGKGKGTEDGNLNDCCCGNARG